MLLLGATITFSQTVILSIATARPALFSP